MHATVSLEHEFFIKTHLASFFLSSCKYCINNLSAISTERWLNDEKVIHKNRGVDSHNNSSHSKPSQCLCSVYQAFVVMLRLSLTKNKNLFLQSHFSETPPQKNSLCWQSFSTSRQLYNKCPWSSGCPPEAAKQNWQNWLLFGYGKNNCSDRGGCQFCCVSLKQFPSSKNRLHSPPPLKPAHTHSHTHRGRI